MKAVNHAANQIDQSLPSLMQVNTQKTTLEKQANQQVYKQTQENIKDSLQSISDASLTYNTVTPQVQEALDRITKRSNTVSDLTLNTPANDTLYSAVMAIGGTAFFNSGHSVTKPPVVHDNYFDFSTLITPEAYSLDEQAAAKNFIDYITKRYQPLTSNIEFDTLKSNLDKLKAKPQVLAQTLHNFMDSQTFKNYQLAVRSTLATQSVGLNNFYKMANERTPIMRTQADPTLAAISLAVGVTPKNVKIDDPKNPGKQMTVIAYASPLQIQNYTANHRLNNQQWYQKMNAASPATVQRETLYILAEIESQLQQSHLDHEQMLATLTALQIQSSNANQMMLQTQANDLNQTIKDLTKPSSGGASNTNNQINQQNAAAQFEASDKNAAKDTGKEKK